VSAPGAGGDGDVRLVTLDQRWVGDVEAMLADPDVLRFTRIPEPPPDGFAARWIAAYAAGREDGTREGFAAVDRDGRFLGIGLAPEIDRAAAELELGYIVTRSARGRGVATRILELLTAWAFDEVGAQRIALIIDTGNHASDRVAERCGYQREGVMRSIHVKAGTRADATLWSRLATDPPPTEASSRTPAGPRALSDRTIGVDHRVMLLELVQEKPSWREALAAALTLPEGMDERREGQDPWIPSTDRPRRISDDLAWLRNAVDEPEAHGLRMIEGSAAAGAWEIIDGSRVTEHLGRLEARGVLEAAGFLFHDDQFDEL